MDRVTLSPFAVDVDLRLASETDPRAPGGAVTVALCGHWDHEGSCRWPHHSRLDTDTANDVARLSTVGAAPEDEQAEVLARIEAELRRDDRWTVLAFRSRPIAPDEQEQAARLAGGG
jgi:hypothetical protein